MNQWYYVGLTHTGTSFNAYIDGQAIGTKTYTRDAPTKTANATVGTHYGLGATDSTNLGSGVYGNFKLGSFHVYKAALSTSDVLANYQATCARFDDACTQRTLYAQWQVAGYDITYSAGDFSTGSSVTVTKPSGVAHTIPDADTSRGYFSRTGHTLTGWATGADGTGTTYDFGDSYATNATLTLYPIWTANTYTVTFNKGSSTGAAGADQTAPKTHGQNLALPDSDTANRYFTKTGYTVTAWSLNADGSTSDFALGANYTTEAIDTLYPVWAANVYTVTYSYDSATGGNDDATSTFTVDGTAITLPTPTKTGYTFAGWYEASNFSGSALGATYSPTQTRTIYAKWTAVTYTILYDYNDSDGGDTTEDSSYTTGSTAITLPTPTKTGYTFAGWYVDSGFSGSAASSPYTTSLNRTLYAKWTAILRTVTYNDTDADSGAVPLDTTDYTIGENIVVKANSGALARDGYTFAGWSQNADGSGVLKNAGETITVETANISLYPKWSANTYTITYNRNGATGGSLARSTDSYTTGAVSGTTLADGGSLTKSGYSFGGWSTTTTGTDPLGALTTNSDITIYAIWSPVDYDFTYDLNGGSGTTPSTQSANVTETVTVSGIGSAVKSGHWFGGWNTSNLGTGSSYAAGSSATIPVGGQTLYAIWVPDTYRISYNANGGTGGPDLSLTDGFDSATFDEPYDIRSIGDLARTGYTFSHWSLTSSGTGSKYDQSQNSLDELTQYTPSANTTFYAQWTAVSYSHTFNVAGGSASLGTYGRTLGQSISMPSPGTKTGYTFDSWSDGTNDYAIGSTYAVTASNRTFTAQWTPNVYSVTYDWQGGASDTPKTSDSFTVGTGPMTLPVALAEGYSRDGYTFSGWSTSVDGSILTSFQPTSDDVLYAVWADGNYTLSYDAKGGVGSGVGTVGRGNSITLPTPVRQNFTFTGWYDSATGGSKVGNGGASYTPANSRSLYARWVQDSLFGVDLATLETGSTYTASNSTSIDTTIGHDPSGTSARVQIPSGALTAGTVITVRYFKETNRQANLIEGENNYFFALLVSWLYGSGDSATVPNTASGKPVTVTLENDAIKAGAMVYQVIGDEVTELGRATADGSVTVELTTDPEIVVAATAPTAPTSVSATSGDTQATVSWTAPNTGGSDITSYTVTASPGGATCTTATTSCDVTGLTNGTSYSFTVTATNAVGTSSSSASSAAVTIAATNYTVSYNSNGGSSVTSASFIAGGSISAPSNSTRSGYTFNGWSTTLNDVATKVTFPYSPGVSSNITLFALWTAVQVVDSGSGGSGSTPTNPTFPTMPTAPSVPENAIKPTPPVTQVTKPIGSVEGSSQAVTVTPDAAHEKLVATGFGWELSVAVENPAGDTAPVREEIPLKFQLANKAAVAGSGLRPNSKVQVWVFSEPTFVGETETNSSGSFETNLALPASILQGIHTLQVISFDSIGRKITFNIPISVVGKVSVGTFKGYIAIFTKDLVGQKLSAKVAGKWLVQNPITNYRTHGYSRAVRKTGAGYKIDVQLYLNGAFLRTEVITTR
ncbi:MAG: InlB B-repeat-containing protein [Aquiluna sp.]|nr:InlB B-repeat-containing protein [Aquiluna sp.]